ncbi:unnamed protein product, partial [marine sediment metagenome]
MVIHVKIHRASATKENVVCDVRFTAIGGPYAGQHLDKQFVYTHPTSVEDVARDLTEFANMLKISLDAPETLE